MSLTHNKFSTQSGPRGQHVNRDVVVYNVHIHLMCGCTPHRMPSVLLLLTKLSLTKCPFMFNIQYFWLGKHIQDIGYGTIDVLFGLNIHILCCHPFWVFGRRLYTVVWALLSVITDQYSGIPKASWRKWHLLVPLVGTLVRCIEC